MFLFPNVALLGKLGHGKTYLLNKLTGGNYPSTSAAKSCTRQLQFGRTLHHGIVVIDTPGFFASDDVAAHIAAQKIALEGVKLSGVFIVVKFGRVDEIAEAVDKVMNFVGSEDVRIIITHGDVASKESGYSPDEVKKSLAKLLDVAASNIMITGKQTPSSSIESFIESTLHEPRDFYVNDEQVANNSNLCTCARSFNKKINDVYSKIAAASRECETVAAQGKTFESDAAILILQKATSDMVAASKEDIFREVDDRELSDEVQNVIYGKAGLSLSLALRNFIDASNQFLSWSVTDTNDVRNQYKKCNHCGAVYNKTEGCDGNTTCGAVPSDVKTRRPILIAEFRMRNNNWVIQYLWNGTEIQVQYVVAQLQSFFQTCRQSWGGGRNHVKRPEAIIESGCGATISWSTMVPLLPEEIECLGVVDLQKAEGREQAAKTTFDDRMRRHENQNRAVLEKFFLSQI